MLVVFFKELFDLVFLWFPLVLVLAFFFLLTWLLVFLVFLHLVLFVVFFNGLWQVAELVHFEELLNPLPPFVQQRTPDVVLLSKVYFLLQLALVHLECVLVVNLQQF